MSGVAAIGRATDRKLAAGFLAALTLAPLTSVASSQPLIQLPRSSSAEVHFGPLLKQQPAGTPIGARGLPVLSVVGGPALERALAPPEPEPAAAPPPPPPPASNVIGGVPLYWQIYALSCESAALQMALAHEGIETSQDQILQVIGSDLRGAYWDAQGMRWGDPYATFVGSVWGSEDYLTGYGTYFPPIARAAQTLNGRVLRAGEGISPAEVYDAILRGHPVVLWIGYDYAFHPRSDYTTFDGHQVLYAGPFEHAVTGVGVNEGSILINDPLSGQFWIDKPVFESTYGTYNQMAVVID